MLSRRELIEGGLAGLLLMYLNSLTFASDTEEVFPQGVASADPTQTGAVLWTRLNPQVHSKLGRDLQLQLSTYPDFRSAQTLRIAADRLHSGNDFTVSLNIENLQPGKTFYYRFIYADVISMVGRFRTLPEKAEDFSLAFVVCQNYPDGYYTAYRHLAQEELDLVVHLGDLIYEKLYPVVRIPERRLSLPSGEDIAVSLEDYRYLYRTYLTDRDFRLARAMHPFVCTWDDHEFLNDYYYDYHTQSWGYFTRHPFGSNKEKILELRRSSIKAWFEYVPSRAAVDLLNPDPLKWVTLYRDFDLGRLGHLIVTDLRSYRERQPCGVRFGSAGCEERWKTSMLGKEQKEWFLKKLGQTGYRWKLWASSVQLSQSQTDGKFASLDAWDGYAGERQSILDFLNAKGSTNLLVLSGDKHASLAAEIPDRYDKPYKVLGAEFITPALSSVNAMEGGWWKRDWSHYTSLQELQKAEIAQNPWIKYINSIDCWGYSLLKLSHKSAECIVYSVDKYSQEADKKVDARFFYREGALERA